MGRQRKRTLEFSFNYTPSDMQGHSATDGLATNNQVNTMTNRECLWTHYVTDMSYETRISHCFVKEVDQASGYSVDN